MNDQEILEWVQIGNRLDKPRLTGGLAYEEDSSLLREMMKVRSISTINIGMIFMTRFCFF